MERMSCRMGAKVNHRSSALLFLTGRHNSASRERQCFQNGGSPVWQWAQAGMHKCAWPNVLRRHSSVTTLGTSQKTPPFWWPHDWRHGMSEFGSQAHGPIVGSCISLGLAEKQMESQDLGGGGLSDGSAGKGACRQV